MSSVEEFKSSPKKRTNFFCVVRKASARFGGRRALTLPRERKTPPLHSWIRVSTTNPALGFARERPHDKRGRDGATSPPSASLDFFGRGRSLRPNQFSFILATKTSASAERLPVRDTKRTRRGTPAQAVYPSGKRGWRVGGAPGAGGVAFCSPPLRTSNFLLPFFFHRSKKQAAPFPSPAECTS